MIRTGYFSHGTGCCCASVRDQKWLLLLLFIAFSLHIEPSLSSCPIPRKVKYGSIEVHDRPYDDAYSNGTKADVSCNPGYTLRSGHTLMCLNGKWISTDRYDTECVRNYEEEVKCIYPPSITHGSYKYPQPAEEYHSPDHSGSYETGDKIHYPVGTELQATCEPMFTLNCPHQRCGRISCDSEGEWVTKEGPRVKSCMAQPLSVIDPNSKNPESIQNYLILALAIVCIFGVGALTVALLRRPLFCKKPEQSHNDPHVMVTSSSPHHAQGGNLDNSIPTAMNSGIFVPGADYDLQDYHLQDTPFVGTTVFK